MRTIQRIAFVSVLCFMLTSIASSASNRSGGGEKKQKQSATLSLNYKKSPLTLQNGYRFRGGLHFNSTSSSSAFANSNVIRFQRGNNLYVLPYKSKPFFNKFKTPQKELK